jgi:hypothetical protein
MKIALYIEDGLEQIVLTPESDTEKGIIGKLSDGSRDLSIKRGSFYACQGGWTRHTKQWPTPSWGLDRNDDDDSTIIVLRPSTPTPTNTEKQ